MECRPSKSPLHLKIVVSHDDSKHEGIPMPLELSDLKMVLTAHASTVVSGEAGPRGQAHCPGAEVFAGTAHVSLQGPCRGRLGGPPYESQEGPAPVQKMELPDPCPHVGCDPNHMHRCSLLTKLCEPSTPPASTSKVLSPPRGGASRCCDAIVS